VNTLPVPKKFPLLLVAASLVLSVLPAAAGARYGGADGPWCGDLAISDWVCRAKGYVEADQVRLLGRGASAMDAETRVVTGPRSLARLTFQNLAQCSLGSGGGPSEIYTRWPWANSLFTQTQGSSSCSSVYGGVPIAVLCKPGDNCNAEVRARGTVLLKISGPAEAVASSTVTVRRWARIVVCAGYVRVAIEDESGSSMSAGGVSGGGRFVIVIEEKTTRVEEPGYTRTEKSLDTSVAGRSVGPGSCDDQSVLEQEETTES
jgi:hypothetical protein